MSTSVLFFAPHGPFRRPGWTLLLAAVFAASASQVAQAQSIDRLVEQLTAQPKACKMPAPFTRVDATVTYQGKPVAGGTAVDPRNWMRPIDFDGDGVCEVLAETCGPATGVRNGDALMCPDEWLVPVKFRNGNWQLANDIGAGGGVERWRGAVTFLYFDRATRQLKLSAFHNFFANASALPALIVTLHGSGIEQVRQINYDVFSDAGPAQQGGVLRTFLAMHANRVMDEYEWRVQHCGGPNGFRDPDSYSARLDDLGEILRQLLTTADIAANQQPRAGGDTSGASSWQWRIHQLLDIQAPKALAACKPPRGYKDIVNSP